MVQTFPLVLVSIRPLVHAYIHSVTDIQLFRVFINLLQAMIFFFKHLFEVFVPFFHSLSCHLLAAGVEPPAVIASKHSPPTAAAPKPAKVCSSLSVLTAPEPSVPHSMVSQSCASALSHYRCRHQRGGVLRDIRHSPSISGLRGLLTQSGQVNRWEQIIYHIIYQLSLGNIMEILFVYLCIYVVISFFFLSQHWFFFKNIYIYIFY